MSVERAIEALAVAVEALSGAVDGLGSGYDLDPSVELAREKVAEARAEIDE